VLGDLKLPVGVHAEAGRSALPTATAAGRGPVGLAVPQYSCLEWRGRWPGLSESELARGAFLAQQSMHSLLASSVLLLSFGVSGWEVGVWQILPSAGLGVRCVVAEEAPGGVDRG
jgi:hypothetical protein